MIPLEYIPVVIEAHRNDLRRLYEPQRQELPKHSRRQRLGALLIRFGQWLDDRCNEASIEAPASTTSQQAGA